MFVEFRVAKGDVVGVVFAGAAVLAEGEGLAERESVGEGGAGFGVLVVVTKVDDPAADPIEGVVVAVLVVGIGGIGKVEEGVVNPGIGAVDGVLKPEVERVLIPGVESGANPGVFVVPAPAPPAMRPPAIAPPPIIAPSGKIPPKIFGILGRFGRPIGRGGLGAGLGGISKFGGSGSFIGGGFGSGGT